jgi:hypothetical protein
MSDPVQIAKEQTEFMWYIGRKETAVFESNSVAYTEEVIMLNARRNLMVWIYCLLRNYKKIKPIEELDRDVKVKMWAFVNEVCAGKTNDLQRKKHICMVFYAIEYFINESNA